MRASCFLFLLFGLYLSKLTVGLSIQSEEKHAPEPDEAVGLSIENEFEADGLNDIPKMTFDNPEKYEGRTDCTTTFKDIEKISYNDTCICQDTIGRECFNTYQTDFVPVTVEVSDDAFEKHCFVDYSPRLRTMTVEVCRNVPERQCPDNVTEIEGPCTPDKCIPEIVCEKSRYHVVEETIPSCKQVNITHCYSGIGGEQCSEIPKTECKMVKANITKYFSPDINCKQVQTNICAAKCEIKFVEQCETFVRQETISVPDESCSITPTKDCREETKMIPKMTLVPKCVQVPRTTCERVRVPFKEVVKKKIIHCGIPDPRVIENTTSPYGFGFSTYLLAGSASRASIFDISTGEFCVFPHDGISFDVDKRGQYFPIQDKTVVCGSNCKTFNGTSWLNNVPNGIPLSAWAQPTALLRDGTWLIPKGSPGGIQYTVYNPATDSFSSPVSVLEASLDDVDDGWCMAYIGDNKFGIITHSGNAHVFDYSTNTLSGIVASTPSALEPELGNEGSCHPQKVNGEHWVIWFPGTLSQCRVVYWNTVDNTMVFGHQYPVACDRADHGSSRFNENEVIFMGGENTTNGTDTAIYKFSVENGFQKVGEMDGKREEMAVVNVPPYYMDLATECTTWTSTQPPTGTTTIPAN